MQHAHRSTCREAAAGVNDAGGKATIFNTITISDGISMGTEGMKYSLVSREVIADSIETVVGCQGFDGFVAIGGCDKNMPGCCMAMARLNRPAVFVYGGTILPGCLERPEPRHRFRFRSGRRRSRRQDRQARKCTHVESCAIPGPGSCGGMYTANTMACAIEALGLSLPNSSAQAAISEHKVSDCRDAGAAVIEHAQARHPAVGHFYARKSFENAITVVIALGGSTNAVLHLLAIAHAANVKLTIDDFTRIGKRVPVLADLKPSGRFMMSQLVEIGGIVPLMKELLHAGLLHGDCLTVTGKTLKQNLAPFKAYPKASRSSLRLSKPLKKDSHLVILRGNLAPEGAVAKISGKEGERFSGTARVFDSEEAAMQAILDGKDQERRRYRHSLRRTARRTRHARDAFADQRGHGPRPRQGCGADHRRTFLRRHSRLCGGPHHARGVRRRTRSPSSRMATLSRSTRKVGPSIFASHKVRSERG